MTGCARGWDGFGRGFAPRGRPAAPLQRPQPRRGTSSPSLLFSSLELSCETICEPYIRALLGGAPPSRNADLGGVPPSRKQLQGLTWCKSGHVPFGVLRGRSKPSTSTSEGYHPTVRWVSCGTWVGSTISSRRVFWRNTTPAMKITTQSVWDVTGHVVSFVANRIDLSLWGFTTPWRSRGWTPRQAFRGGI